MSKGRLTRVIIAVGICFVLLILCGRQTKQRSKSEIPAKSQLSEMPFESVEAELSTVNTDTKLAAALRQSDDYKKHRTVFLKASKKLIRKGTCSIADFRENGGWIRSTSHPGFYFTYCGAVAHRNNRVYLHPMYPGFPDGLILYREIPSAFR